ncbi:IMPACT family protein [Mesorhizobium shangrilense]|uniref:YigZ family protein n=1 Tax=Mesorhizobium shangrilense TaxID=460060 RepID=A0ABV2DIA1_9HYPH
MFSIEQPVTFRQEIKKSRFLAVAGPVSTEEAARQFVAAHSDLGANHNCWAWRIGVNYRLSDDGEPGGTAGKPILQALDGQSLDSIAIVVTRWFGGTLLGSGGLMRAYGGTASACLRAAIKIPIVATVEATITCGFSDLALVQARLATSPGVRVLHENFIATGAELTVAMPAAEAVLIGQMVTDLSNGRATVLLPD